MNFLFSAWRINLVVLSLQFVGIFFYLTRWYPIEQSIIYLLSALFSISILGLAVIRSGEIARDLTVSQTLNRLFIYVFLVLALFLVRYPLEEFFQISRLTIILSMSLIVIGLIMAFDASEMFKRIIGFLTLFSGFQLIFMEIDQTLVTLSSQSVINLL
ncbi:MAG: hypothetical protein GWN62_02825, partial [Aliifodinibius sp.]|nr:hypothetical protein [Fodinibius sp.]